MSVRCGQFHQYTKSNIPLCWIFHEKCTECGKLIFSSFCNVRERYTIWFAFKRRSSVFIILTSRVDLNKHWFWLQLCFFHLEAFVAFSVIWFAWFGTGGYHHQVVVCTSGLLFFSADKAGCLCVWKSHTIWVSGAMRFHLVVVKLDTTLLKRSLMQTLFPLYLFHQRESKIHARTYTGSHFQSLYNNWNSDSSHRKRHTHKCLHTGQRLLQTYQASCPGPVWVMSGYFSMILNRTILP